MRRVLITGINGFAGSYLAELLLEEADVWGLYLHNNFENITAILPRLNLVECDLLDAVRVNEVVGEIRPDTVFHLAAQSAPSLSYADPGATLNTNIFSTLNILEATAAHCSDAVFLNVGSADEYGNASESELPVKETAELRPLNPYSVSKVAQDMLGYQYHKERGLNVVRCRPFNYIGPRQAEHFVASAFAKQIVEVEVGLKGEPQISVGNLASARDFLHVKDVVTAYSILAKKGEPGEVYNICSGKAISIQGILDILLGLSKVEIEVVKDPERFRVVDCPVTYGDASKIRGLGWEPKQTIEAALEGILNHWRERIK